MPSDICGNPHRQSGEPAFGARCRPKSAMKTGKPAGLTAGILSLLLTLCILTSIPARAIAAQVTLAWKQTDTASIDGYKLFARLEGNQYNYQAPSWSGTATSTTLDNLEDNATYYFVVRAVMGSLESSDSNEVQYKNEVVAAVPLSTTTGSGADVIIDNDSAGATSTGKWQTSGGSSPYGSNSLYSKDIGASYIYTSDLSGRYEVALWWSSYGSRCSDVPVEIYNDNELLDTVSINQLQNGGMWNVLGSYDFTGQARVVVVASDSGCSTCADAAEFIYNDTAANSSTADNSSGTVDSAGNLSNAIGTQDTVPTVDTANDAAIKVIDNSDQGTSSIGKWQTSGGSSPYGSNSLYSKDIGASYTYASDLSGRYEVSLWWSSYGSRCSDVPVEIYNDDELLDTVSINQLQNGGMWNVIGSYDFTGQARVVVVASDSGCSTCADAAEFIYDDTAANSSTADNSSGNVDTASDAALQVIDNSDQGTSSTGKWQTSGGSSPYGSNSLYSKDIGASYTYTSDLSGRYEVSLWWSSYGSRCSDVPVEVWDGNRLLDTISVNQRQNGGGWNSLGNYLFTGQASVKVVVRDSDCSTCADAVSYSK